MRCSDSLWCSGDCGNEKLGTFLEMFKQIFEHNEPKVCERVAEMVVQWLTFVLICVCRSAGMCFMNRTN